MMTTCWRGDVAARTGAGSLGGKAITRSPVTTRTRHACFKTLPSQVRLSTNTPSDASLQPMPIEAAEPPIAASYHRPAMLYLVGGPPRTGKSALGLAFLKARGVPWLSLDVMRTVLRRIVQEVDDVDGGFG